MLEFTTCTKSFGPTSPSVSGGLAPVWPATGVKIGAPSVTGASVAAPAFVCAAPPGAALPEAGLLTLPRPSPSGIVGAPAADALVGNDRNGAVATPATGSLSCGAAKP